MARPAFHARSRWIDANCIGKVIEGICEAVAAQCGNSSAGFDSWKQQFAQEAAQHGVSRGTLSALMATESSRRALTEAQREREVPHQPRRAVALLLQRAAHRLDPYVTSAPRVTLGR